jgi:hypothetical protein
MKKKLEAWVECQRVDGAEGDGCYGKFLLLGPERKKLLVIVSDGRDWEAEGLGGPAWEHASVSLEHRCPTWMEMEWVRRTFWDEDEWVMQLHPPKDKYINLHSTCLHLWRPTGEPIPRPPRATV